MNAIKKTLLAIVMILITAVGYALVDNRNQPNMTFRQKLLKSFYPVFMWFQKKSGNNAQVRSNEKQMAQTSFYDLKFPLNGGDTLDFATLKGKKVMLVNTASNCGYTRQYEGLQSLYEKHKENLIILAFPANDFKEQEKGSNEEIAEFCKKNYGVTFPLLEKSGVIKNADQNPVFQWLTDASKNGWNNEPPTWNFTKFLVNEKGELTNYFGPSVEPESDEILDAIKK